MTLLVKFRLLSGHLLGNSCPLGWPYVLIVFCLFVVFIYIPFWFLKRDLAFALVPVHCFLLLLLPEFLWL